MGDDGLRRGGGGWQATIRVSWERDESLIRVTSLTCYVTDDTIHTAREWGARAGAKVSQWG